MAVDHHLLEIDSHHLWQRRGLIAQIAVFERNEYERFENLDELDDEDDAGDRKSVV